jgi:hypothetical protein
MFTVRPPSGRQPQKSSSTVIAPHITTPLTLTQRAQKFLPYIQKTKNDIVNCDRSLPFHLQINFSVPRTPQSEVTMTCICLRRLILFHSRGIKIKTLLINTVQYNKHICYPANSTVELRQDCRIKQGRLTCNIKETAVNKDFGT